MWRTRGAGEFAKNAFSAAANFGRTGIGHFFVPPHFSCPWKMARSGEIVTNCDPQLTPSSLWKKILDHHGDCWQGERSTKRVKRQPQNVLNLVRNQQKSDHGDLETHWEWCSYDGPSWSETSTWINILTSRPLNPWQEKYFPKMRGILRGLYGMACHDIGVSAIWWKGGQ